MLTTRVGQEEAPPRDASPEKVVGYFQRLEEVLCAYNLHTLARDQHAPSAFYFFINIKTVLTPHKIYKKNRSAKDTNTPKDKSIKSRYILVISQC
jgi:hypothetical protein